jgi:hypothetical protein
MDGLPAGHGVAPFIVFASISLLSDKSALLSMVSVTNDWKIPVENPGGLHYSL